MNNSDIPLELKEKIIREREMKVRYPYIGCEKAEFEKIDSCDTTGKDVSKREEQTTINVYGMELGRVESDKYGGASYRTIGHYLNYSDILRYLVNKVAELENKVIDLENHNDIVSENK